MEIFLTTAKHFRYLRNFLPFWISDNFICFYQVMRSGIPNFCAVALALNDLGYVQKDYMNFSSLVLETILLFCFCARTVLFSMLICILNN